MQTMKRGDKATIVPSQCEDWELIVATNCVVRATDLPVHVKQAVLMETWKYQDGYGTPGYTPSQGWDWSGIRDSSEIARKNMAAAIRRILCAHNIESFVTEKII